MLQKQPEVHFALLGLQDAVKHIQAKQQSICVDLHVFASQPASHQIEQEIIMCILLGCYLANWCHKCWHCK